MALKNRDPRIGAQIPAELTSAHHASGNTGGAAVNRLNFQAPAADAPRLWEDTRRCRQAECRREYARLQSKADCGGFLPPHAA